MDTIFLLVFVFLVVTYGYFLSSVSTSDSAADLKGYWKWLKSWFVRDDGSQV